MIGTIPAFEGCVMHLKNEMKNGTSLKGVMEVAVYCTELEPAGLFYTTMIVCEE